MCTVSWGFAGKGYQVFCNRDEHLTRRPARAPSRYETNGVAYLCPRDGDHGGTWVAVNRYGVTFCLLNHRYDLDGGADDRDGSFRTRGEIIPALSAARDLASVRQALAGLDCEDYRPFTCAAFSPHGSLLTAVWGGRRLDFAWRSDRRGVVTSSSFASHEVECTRAALFHKLVAERSGDETELLTRYHQSHYPSAGPYSVCLHRADAATLSLTRVRVTESEAGLWYYPSSPCRLAQENMRPASGGKTGEAIHLVLERHVD